MLAFRPASVLLLTSLLTSPGWAQQTSPPPPKPPPANQPAPPPAAKPTAPAPAAAPTNGAPKPPAAAPATPAPGTTSSATGVLPSVPTAAPGAPAAAPAAPTTPAAAPKPAPAVIPALAPKPAPPPATPAKPAKPAAPEPSPAQVKKARELWYRGVDAFRNGRYEEARQAFSECYALMPKSDVLRNLSISEIQSGHYVSAARHLSTLLSGTDLPADVREEATRRLAQAEAQIGKLNVNVDVPGAVVAIDGVAIGRTPLDGAWYIEPGQHEVSVSKPSYPNETRQIYALAGVAIPVTVSLEELRREQERDAHAAELMGTREGETPRERGISTASTITLLSTGTLAAVGLVAGIYYTASAKDHDTAADTMAGLLPGNGSCRPSSPFQAECERFWKDQEDSRNDRRRAQVSFIGFGVASAATLGYALYLLLDTDDKEAGRKSQASVDSRRLEPGVVLGADGASFSLQGQF